MSLTEAKSKHIPVMVKEVLEGLRPRDGGIYIDGTFGQGGYSQALLAAADCRVVGIDRDPDAIKKGRSFEQKWPDRFNIVEGRFGNMVHLMAEKNVHHADGIALDLGVSSLQLDESERGFSFRMDGPLDMRMDKKGPTAAELVNNLEEQDLANLIYELGQERYARRIARKIVNLRKTTPFTTTLELAQVVRSVVREKRRGLDPATRTFQALRIKVNDELEELDRGLRAAEILLKPQGRLAVVSFHSLEDRRVKSFLQERTGQSRQTNRHDPFLETPLAQATFTQAGRKVIKPAQEEVDNNPRARSARLRVAERSEALLHEI